MIPSKGAYLFAHFMLIGIIITPNTSEFRMEEESLEVIPSLSQIHGTAK